ncbi:hypothetical protein OC834_007368 [Tilletia horrida]|nr:hypothetical protein OC834_007368 [Tilletia horrida]KAK0544881.1 hypothetical protein OC844_007423 [Tilletia horrida]
MFLEANIPAGTSIQLGAGIFHELRVRVPEIWEALDRVQGEHGVVGLDESDAKEQEQEQEQNQEQEQEK